MHLKWFISAVQELVSRFNFHNFDNLRGFNQPKQDPRTAKIESKAQILFDLLFSAAAGDISALRRYTHYFYLYRNTQVRVQTLHFSNVSTIISYEEDCFCSPLKLIP